MRSMRKIILFTIAIIYSLYSMAQKETYNWAFGYNGGLTWNTTRSVNVAKVNTATGAVGSFNIPMGGLPTDFYTEIRTFEGCFSLSDNKGDLVFYSDGVTIWDKNNEKMPNGIWLQGNSSSAQSGVIMPYPGSLNKYLVVTVQAGAINGIHYSIVDMSLNGGKGDVSSKNIELKGKGSISESATVIRHANGTDFWIVAPGRNGNSFTYFNAWKVTKDSVSTVAVTTLTNLPSSINVPAYGYFKISPDGKHFAYGENDDYRILFGDFDNETGVVSNAKLKNLKSNGNVQCYGVEFSPSGKILYVGGKVSGSTNGSIAVIKFDELLEAPNPATFPYKTLQINGFSGALQTGPDKRIYGSNSGRKDATVIDNIEDYDNLEVYMLPSNFISGTFQLGLPSFSSSWFSAKTSDVKPFICTGKESEYKIEVNLSGLPGDLPTKLEWDFGDGSPIVTQDIIAGETTYKQLHTYIIDGAYTVTIIPYRSDETPLTPIEIPANAINCVFKTNRMIRTDLQNSGAKQTNR